MELNLRRADEAHAHELGFQLLEPLLALNLDFWIERYARAQQLTRNRQSPTC